MKTTTKSLAPSLIAALCLTLGIGLGTADPTGKDQPARFNKATGIVGMEVINQKGEHLGQIKDIVFDLSSERIAYAVLGTSGPTEKLLAVSMNALTPSTDSERLILRADKASLDSAKGLTADNWPAPVSPVWGAQPPGTTAPHVSLPRR